MLNEADLSACILTGAKLSGALLEEADASWTDWDGADLSGASLTGATAHHASFKNAFLTDADLSRADLQASSFLGADMEGVSIDGTDLSRAGLLRAKIGQSALSHARTYGMGLPETALNNLTPLLQRGHDGDVSSVSFSPDGKILASSSGEKASLIRLVRHRDGRTALEEMISLYHLPDDEWAAIDDQNRFVCSEGGRNYLAFTDNLAVYPARDLPELEHPEGLFAVKSKRAPRTAKSAA